MNKSAKIFVAGHNGMVGSAICRLLLKEGFDNLVTRSSKELDLRNQAAVANFFATEKPEYVFLAAAKVGGIAANNTYRADFLYENLMIEANVIHSAHVEKVKKLLFLGSSCIYPKFAIQPIDENQLLTGVLEPTNEPYAIAKIAGLKMCETYRQQYGDDFISLMPTNLYGPNDNYHSENSHVIPALIKKFHFAKENNLPEVEMWGSGTPLREFLHVDDLAEASVYAMLNYSEEGFLNVGSTDEITIRELAEMIAEVVGYSGEIKNDLSKPDGTPRKKLDTNKINAFGWNPRIGLKEGLATVYANLDWSQIRA